MLESCDHIAGSTPGPIEILQGITLQPLHMVVKMEPGTNGLKYGFMDQQSLRAMAKKFPEYFQLMSEQLPRMVSDAKRQREFLLRFGGDANIFKSVEIQREVKPPK